MSPLANNLLTAPTKKFKTKPSLPLCFLLACCIGVLFSLGTLFNVSLKSHYDSNNDGTVFSDELKRQRITTLFGGAITTTAASSTSTNNVTSAPQQCRCTAPPPPSSWRNWTSQKGQDAYLYTKIFQHLDLCCNGVFIEFGARDGVADSNTYILEKHLQWKGLLYEIEPSDIPKLYTNRQRSVIKHGPICPLTQTHVEIMHSHKPGFTGAFDTIGKNTSDKLMSNCFLANMYSTVACDTVYCLPHFLNQHVRTQNPYGKMQNVTRNGNINVIIYKQSYVR